MIYLGDSRMWETQTLFYEHARYLFFVKTLRKLQKISEIVIKEFYILRILVLFSLFHKYSVF